MSWFNRAIYDELRREVYTPPQQVGGGALEFSTDARGNMRGGVEIPTLEVLKISIIGNPNLTEPPGLDTNGYYFAYVVDSHYNDANSLDFQPEKIARVRQPEDGSQLMDAQYIMGVCLGLTQGGTDPDDNNIYFYLAVNTPQQGFLCLYDASLNDFLDPWPKNSISPLRILGGGCCVEVDLGVQLLACNKFGPIPDGNLIFVMLAGQCFYAVATECG